MTTYIYIYLSKGINLTLLLLHLERNKIINEKNTVPPISSQNHVFVFKSVLKYIRSEQILYPLDFLVHGLSVPISDDCANSSFADDWSLSHLLNEYLT